MQSIPKFVINLKRRPDRLKTFFERCPLTDVTVYNAFDAKNYTNESEEAIQIFNKVRCLYPGESGCFTSHLCIFKEIVEKNYEYALIFEDDAEFCNSFLEKYNSVMDEIPVGAEIIYLGGRFIPNFMMAEGSYIQVSNNIVQHMPTARWDGLIMDRTTHAYIISNSGAKRMIQKVKESGVINQAFDHWMCHLFFDNNLAIYNSSPLLCHSPMVSDSDIRKW